MASRARKLGATAQPSIILSRRACSRASRRRGATSDVPSLSFTTFPPTPITVKVREDLIRTYANWVAGKRVSASAEYVHENVDNHGTFFAQGYSDLRTDRVPLHVNFHGEKRLQCRAHGDLGRPTRHVRGCIRATALPADRRKRHLLGRRCVAALQVAEALGNDHTVRQQPIRRKI